MNTSNKSNNSTNSINSNKSTNSNKSNKSNKSIKVVDKNSKNANKLLNLNNMNKSNKSTEMNNILVKLFEHQLLVKMFHFQTLSYATHKAMDEYLDKFQDALDTYMEVYQGLVKSRVSLKKLKIDVTMVKNNNEMIEKLEDFINSVLNDMMNYAIDNNNSLLNIRDEMVANAQKTQYLLTFS